MEAAFGSQESDIVGPPTPLQGACPARGSRGKAHQSSLNMKQSHKTASGPLEGLGITLEVVARRENLQLASCVEVSFRTKRGASACPSPSFTALLSHPSTATRIMLPWEHLLPAGGVNQAFHQPSHNPKRSVQPLENGHVTLHSTQLKGNLSLCDSKVHS